MPRSAAAEALRREPQQVTVAMTCPGYESHVTFELHSVDAQAAFCHWLEMQLRYLRVRQGDTTVEVRETTHNDGDDHG
jgi:hypothetical protein